MLVLITEILTIVLSIYSYYLLAKFYLKTKMSWLPLIFGIGVSIWSLKAISRILTHIGVIGIPDIEIWSTLGLLQACIFIYMFWRLAEIIEEYL